MLDDPIALLALVFIPGYLFLQTDLELKFKAPYLSRVMLYATILVYGSIAMLASDTLLWLLVQLANHFLDKAQWLAETPSSIKSLLLVVFACLIIWSYAKLRNRRTNEADVKYDIISKYGTELQKFSANFVLECYPYEDQIFIEVTLKNNKVYIGLPDDFPRPLPPGSNEYFNILPMYSGYRTEVTHQLEITTNYIQHYQDHLVEDEESYKVSIAGSEVLTVKRFNSKVYFGAFSRAEGIPDHEF